MRVRPPTRFPPEMIQPEGFFISAGALDGIDRKWQSLSWYPAGA